MQPKFKKILVIVLGIYIIGNYFTQMNTVNKIAELEHRISHLEGLKDTHNS